MRRTFLAFPPEIRNVILAFMFTTSVILYLYLVKFDGNITGFFRIGSILPLSPYLIPEKILIFSGEVGYDGQQFLSIALDPFLENPGTIEALDHPAYRYRRIFYPLISYLVSWGNRAIIPYIMVGINYLSILLIVWISSLYLKSQRGTAWQPLLSLCIPGVWIVLSLSTADLLSSLFLVTALYGYRQHKPILTATAIAIACLTRETMLLIWLAFLLASIWQRKQQQITHLLWAWMPALLWNFYVVSLKLPGESGVKANFGYPFVGIVHKFMILFMGEFSINKLFEAYLFILLLSSFVAIFWIAHQYPQENRIIRACTLLYAVLFSLSSIAILGYYLDYSRVYIDIYFLLLLSFNYSLIPGKTGILLASGLASIAFLALQS